MKNIQSLTLMMAVMVYAAPTPPTPPTTTTTTTTTRSEEAMLNRIHKIAETLLHNESLKELNFKVHAVTPDDGPRCTKEIFCLAEKVLKSPQTSEKIKNANLTGTVATTVDTLKRQLHQYNIRTNVHCHLNTTWGIRPMEPFLRAIAC